ncbi:hypothetical protein GCM10011396_08710 [Undibacterium terreum]|uniref:Uncharacterized protein n=2 Tax=Undibacterium terreum TaxID=1224302 RepID=A0A916U803_9BURK|nr:hypothetical protein GCM10011396_08710 [Undibacterium terreum]
MMRLSESEKSVSFASGSSYNQSTRNILFISGTDKKAHWLFPTQAKLILAVEQLNEKIDDAKEKPTQALYFEYVDKDSNGDGTLSHLDQSNIALAKPDGSGFIDVLHGVDRVISYELLSEKEISIVYQVGKSIKNIRLSAISFAKESEQEIISIPD